MYSEFALWVIRLLFTVMGGMGLLIGLGAVWATWRLRSQDETDVTEATASENRLAIPSPVTTTLAVAVYGVGAAFVVGGGWFALLPWYHVFF